MSTPFQRLKLALIYRTYTTAVTFKYANTGNKVTMIGYAYELMITLKKFHCGCSDATLAVDHSVRPIKDKIKTVHYYK